MSRKSKVEAPEAAADRLPAPAPGPASPADRVRDWLANFVAGMLIGPVMGVIAGFFLLFGGIFLDVAWIVGPKALFEAQRYHLFTSHVDGRIVESWMALDLDPTAIEPSHRWFAYARISACAVVEYPRDWAPMRRAFCGNRFTFRDDFRLHDWDSLAPGIPFAFVRDESGFMVQEVRMGRGAAEWLRANPPHSTFALSKPPPSTALGALREQFDRPAEVAAASWATPVPAFPLAYDPRHPEDVMPARYVADAREGFPAWGFLVSAILAVPGFLVWRLGMTFLFSGQRPWVRWTLILAPLLALPWWSDVLPRLVRPANRDWASVATDMLDDVHRTTRLVASAPEDAALADGERVVWRLDRGAYADTFGKVHFERPAPAPATAEDALTVLREQVDTQVRKLDGGEQASLFARLEAQHQAGLDGCQKLFTLAAENTLRDREGDKAARRAARHFLSFVMNYNDWDLDALGPRP
jgi:hypothetical protein